MFDKVVFFIHPKKPCSYKGLVNTHGLPDLGTFQGLSGKALHDQMTSWLNKNIYEGGVVSMASQNLIFMLGQMAFDNAYSKNTINCPVSGDKALTLMRAILRYVKAHDRSLMAAGSAIDPRCGGQYKVDLTQLSYTERQKLVPKEPEERELPEQEVG